MTDPRKYSFQCLAFLVSASAMLVGCGNTGFLTSQGDIPSTNSPSSGGAKTPGATTGKTAATPVTANKTTTTALPKTTAANTTPTASTAAQSNTTNQTTNLNDAPSSQQVATASQTPRVCTQNFPLPAQNVLTTNAPFLQAPGGFPIAYPHWLPHSGDHPSAPMLAADNLQTGDLLSVVGQITGSINDGSDSGNCQNGAGGQANLLKHIPIIQFTNSANQVMDPGWVTLGGFGALALRDLQGQPFVVPLGVTRAFVSIGDSRYSDNHSTCRFTLVIQRQVAC